MGGLSSTLYDTGSIEIVGGHSAAATSGSTISGRALSATAIDPTDVLRMVELELVEMRSAGDRYWGAGFTDASGGLTGWIGIDSAQGVYVGLPSADGMRAYQSGALLADAGGSSLAVGTRICLWLHPPTRRVWVGSRPRNGWLVGTTADARPDLGTGQNWTVPGTGPIRVALTPGFGSGADRNVVRLRSRHHELHVIGSDAFGALPWDARTITVTGPLDAADVSPGETLLWAWFDHATPSAIATAPTSRGSSTVLAGPAYWIQPLTSLDPTGHGSLVVMRSDGTPLAARSHYAPVVVP